MIINPARALAQFENSDITCKGVQNLQDTYNPLLECKGWDSNPRPLTRLGLQPSAVDLDFRSSSDWTESSSIRKNRRPASVP